MSPLASIIPESLRLDARHDRLARLLAEAFHSHGHSLFLVGGVVRDALLRTPAHELDFATSARPAETLEILQTLALGTPYRVGEKYGTIGCHAGATRIEITTFRSGERYEPGSRKPEVRFGNTITEDLSRRDFTINAIALDPLSGQLVDPFQGMADLERRVLKTVGVPTQRFAEDPLRILRGVRFAARLGLSIEEETWRAMQASAAELESISRERIRDEYSAYLESDQPSRALILARDAGLLQHSVPQLTALTLMPDHGPSHPLSLWDHTMRVVDAVRADLVLRWAALLHDIAKPETRTREADGRTRFFHHETRGAEIARDTLVQLRYPGVLIDEVVLLVETHMQLHAFSPEWSDGAVRRLSLRLGTNTSRAIELARADASGHSEVGLSSNSPKFDLLEERLAELSSTQTAPLQSPLTGDDLMLRYARPPGPVDPADKRCAARTGAGRRPGTE